LNTQANSAAQATIRSRVLADLVVLEHFSKTHEAEVKTALKEKGDKAINAFEELYDKNKTEGSIYEHRLDSIMR